MKHFIAQFGPALEWPWTKLMDVPDLTDDLVNKIADQSDAQSGQHSIRALERMRDNNLVAMMRGLKTQNAAAGALIKTHEAMINKPDATDFCKPLKTISRTIPADWVDYNGHMNESRYGQVFSDAADTVLDMLGAGPDYVATGKSYFTVNIDINFVLETHVADQIVVESQILLLDGKKLKLFHRMQSASGALLATGEQFLLHVDLTTRKSCPPEDALLSEMVKKFEHQKALPQPD